MKLYIFAFFFFLVEFAQLKLCPFFKNDGLICQKGKIKGLILDKNLDRLITFGQDSVAIIWDLMKMNDLKSLQAQNSQIIAIHIDQNLGEIIILNQNGYLSNLSYPSGQINKAIQISQKRITELTFFHPSLPYIFIFTQENTVQVLNYQEQNDSTEIVLSDRVLKQQIYDRGEYSYVIFFLEKGSILQYKIQINNTSNRQSQQIVLDNSHLDISTQNYLSSVNFIVAITLDKMRLIALSYDYNSEVWKITPPPATLIILFLRLDDASLIALFLDNNYVQLYSQLKGKFIDDQLFPVDLSKLTNAYYIQSAKRFIFYDDQGSIFICSYSSQGNLNYQKKAISFNPITSVFLAESYVIIETTKEQEGFFVYNSITETLDSIKCLTPQSNFEIGQYPEGMAKKQNTVFDADNSIIIRYFLTEIDAWNYRTKSQIFYDNTSLNKYTDENNNIENEIIDVAIDNARGILITVQLDKTIFIWDYQSGIVTNIYNEVEVPSKIFYHQQKKTFVIKEQTKIILFKYQKVTNQSQDKYILNRTENNKSYHIISMLRIQSPPDLYYQQVEIKDSTTKVATQYFKFYSIDGGLIQSPSEIEKGYIFTGYDQTNNIFLAFYQTNIIFNEVGFLINDKLSISISIPKYILLKTNTTSYQYCLKEKQKQILIATETKLFLYSYSTNSLLNEISYSKISRDNILVSYLEAINLIILYNSQFLLTLDGTTFLQIKNYLTDKRFTIYSIYIQQTHILISLQDNKIVILETSNLRYAFLELSYSQLVQKFIEYQEYDNIVIVQFQDGRVGVINAESPYFKSDEIKTLNSEQWNMKHFIKDEKKNEVSFNVLVNNQFQVAKINLDRLTIQKQIVEPITQNENEIAYVKFLRIVYLPNFLLNDNNTEYDDNKDQNINDYDDSIEHILVFQKRRNIQSSQETLDVFLINSQTKEVKATNLDIHSEDITKEEHGLFTIKNSIKQMYVCMTYSEKEKVIKIWSLPTLKQLNKTLYLKNKLKVFTCEFNTAQMIYSLESSNSIQIYDMYQGSIIKIIYNLLSQCTSIIVNYEQNILVVGEQIGRISVYQYSSFIPILILPSIDSQVNSLRIDDSCKYLIVGSESNKIYIYMKQSQTEEISQLIAYEQLHIIQLIEQTSCVFIQAKLNVLFTCQPGIVKAWNLSTGLLLGQALVDPTKQEIKKLYFSIYSRILILCTQQNIFVFDSLYITNDGFMMNLISMKTPIQDVLFMKSKNLLVYSQLMNEKSVGTVEYWDNESEKMKIIHSGLTCKPIKLINIEYFLAIQCQYQLLIINSNDLIQKSAFQLSLFPLQFEVIKQSIYYTNHLYGISQKNNIITLLIVCTAQGSSKPNLIEYSSIQFLSEDFEVTPTNESIESISQMFFLNKEFILISDLNGSFIVVSSDLKQQSRVIKNDMLSPIQGVIQISHINFNSKFILYDKSGNINIYFLSYEKLELQVNDQDDDTKDEVNKDDERCYSSKIINNERFNEQIQSYGCDFIPFQNISNMNIDLVIASNYQALGQPYFVEITILEKVNCMAFITQGLETLSFISLSDLKSIEKIFIPIHNQQIQIISCRKAAIFILLTSFQVNIFHIQYNENPNPKWNISQNYILIDSQLGFSQNIIFVERYIFVVTCQKGYKILELVNEIYKSDEIKWKQQPNQHNQNLISKHITYLDFAKIANYQFKIDSQGHPNIQLIGYHQKGLFMHIVPLVSENICQHEIMETDFLLVEKSLKFLETTYDTTEIKFDQFYIIIQLNQMKKLIGIPDLTFKYNSTLHLKGLPNQKKVIGFQMKQNQERVNLDVGSWDSFILENVVLLPVYDQDKQSYLELSIINSNNGCKNLALIGVDFAYQECPSQKGINPPQSDKCLRYPLHLNISNIFNVTFEGINYKNQVDFSSSAISIVNSLYLNIISFKVDYCQFEDSNLINLYSENLSSNRTIVQITNLSVSRSIINRSRLFVIDNSQWLIIDEVETKYNKGTNSLVFFLSGITNHTHSNSNFYCNSGLSYIEQVSSIQKSQPNSFDYSIQNSNLLMLNILIHTNDLDTSVLQLEISSINMTNIQIRNINLLSEETQTSRHLLNLEQENSLPLNNQKDKDIQINQINQNRITQSDNSINNFDIETTLIHFENKKNANSFFISDFSHLQYQSQISVPSLFIEYEEQMSKNMSIKSNFTQSLIVLKHKSAVTIQQSKFESILSFEHIIQGKEIDLKVDSCLFRKISANNLKGILFFSQSTVDVRNSIFRDNQSFFCTCIYIQDYEIQQENNIFINNTFYNNSAQLSGGAFCGINTSFQFQDNKFHLNSALVGGGIYYYYLKQSEFIQQNLTQVILTSNYFSQNSCKILGNNIGSNPKYFKINDFNQNMLDRYELEQFRSGGYINLNIILFDEEDKLISIKDTPQAIFILTMQDFQNLRLNDYSAVQLQYNSTLDLSTFSFTKQQIIGMPNQNASFKFSSPSLQKGIQSNPKEEQGSSGLNTLRMNELNLDISFRSCIIGEVYSQDTIKDYYTCRECNEDPQSFKMNNQKCMLCPTSKASYCQKEKIYVNQGYWRLNNSSDEIFECINNPQNCAGNDTCKIGHLGPLCEDCDISGEVSDQKYSRVGLYSYECTSCQDSFIQQVFVCGLILCMSFYLSWSVKQSIDRAKATVQVDVMRKIKMISLGRSSFISLTAAYIKIAADYFQIVSGLKYFAINYPNTDLVVDTIGDSLSKTSYSLDCFLSNNFTLFPLNYARIIWVHFNALIYLMVFAFIYKGLVYLKIVNQKTYIWTNALILFSLFTQYSIMSILISSLSCRKISNKKYVKFIISMECWGEEHTSLFINLLLPLLIIQILSFLIKFYLLFSIRKELNNYFNILKYGLLYLEYTPQNYLWEFVKTLKRMLVTLFINIFDQNNQIKGIMCALIFIVYFFILGKLQPFRKASLNKLEKKSTIVQIILYFLAVLESQKDQNQAIFAIMIYSINLLFISLLLYTVIKKNKLYLKIISKVRQIISNKLPKLHSCLNIFFEPTQPQVRILWRNLAWHVSEFLERRKKDKNAQMFLNNNEQNNSTLRYKLKDMRSSQQIKQFYLSQQTPTIKQQSQQQQQQQQQQQTDSNIQNLITFPETIQNSTTLEMTKLEELKKLHKKNSIHISDSIFIDDKKINKNKNKQIIFSSGSNGGDGGGITLNSFKSSQILKNQDQQNKNLQLEQSSSQGDNSIKNKIKQIIDKKAFAQDITYTHQQTETTQSNIEKESSSGQQTNSLNPKASSKFIPTEYDYETESIFLQYYQKYSSDKHNIKKKDEEFKQIHHDL